MKRIKKAVLLTLASIGILALGVVILEILFRFLIGKEYVEGWPRIIISWVLAAGLCMAGRFLRDYPVMLGLTRNKLTVKKVNLVGLLGFAISICGILLIIWAVGVEEWILWICLGWMAWGAGSLFAEFAIPILFRECFSERDEQGNK